MEQESILEAKTVKKEKKRKENNDDSEENEEDDVTEYIADIMMVV